MGYGGFNTTASADRAAVRMSTGATAFKHDVDARAGRVAKLHPSMDLTVKCRRECRDNDTNPSATPIAVQIDVTGSMREIPGYVIDALHKAVEVIKAGGVVQYPSLLFGAIGDATSDAVPVQMGEFEASDELAEAHLANIYREGNGGGQNMESYELFLWFFANQVDTDAWDKRGEKGFLFIIGDEAPYPMVKPTLVAHYMGGNIREPVNLASIAAKVQEKWHVFILRPGGTSCFGDASVRKAWTDIFPAERVIDIPDWNDIVPTIAGTVSVMSGLSLDDTIAAMHDAGLSTKGSSTALATVADSATLAVAGSTDLSGTGSAGATRL